MPHKIGIYYDQSGLDDIMIGHKMEEMERSIMLQKKSEIEAAFFADIRRAREFQI